VAEGIHRLELRRLLPDVDRFLELPRLDLSRRRFDELVEFFVVSAS
jgi:hypothetical protein